MFKLSTHFNEQLYANQHLHMDNNTQNQLSYHVA